MSKERLTDPNMKIDEMVYTLTNGHPGSIILFKRILINGSQIDPDDIFGGFGTIMSMDMFGIHDHRPYYLFNDVCKQDFINTMGMVRACQLGLISENVLLHAIDNKGDGLDIEGTMIRLREILPEFGKTEIKEESHLEKLKSLIARHGIPTNDPIERTVDITIEKSSI